MSKTDLQKIKNVSYGGIPAHLFLWQKAFFLIPVWAIIMVPAVGFICRGMGRIPMEVGFALVICLSAIYFLQDLLKRKIRMDGEYIFFGFQAIPIKSITSVDIVYKKGRFLPAALVLICSTGKRLKLNLNGLTGEGVDTLLKQIQLSNSNLKTAAVLNTLVKCRTTKRKALENPDRLEIPYQSRRFISESMEAFISTAARWARIGPVLVCLLTLPNWMRFVSMLYCSLQPRVLNQNATETYLHGFLNQCFDSFGMAVGKAITTTAQSVSPFASNSAVALCTGSAVALFLFYLLHLAWKPNWLTADGSGIKLVLRFADFSMVTAQVPWSQVQTVDLLNSGSKTGYLRITRNDSRHFDINLASIEPEDRSLLLKRIERLVPTNRINPELSQAMLAKSDRSYTEIWLQSLNQAPERRTMDPLEPGQLVGDSRFEVLRSIGVGGQGRAYLCRQLDGEQMVVLKETIIPVFADGSCRRKSLENFEQEASLLKRFDNDGVVKLMDYFVEDHRAYLVLEHIDGCNLRELVLKEGALPEEQVRDLALQMCKILKALHSDGIVHRDFNPDNLILNSQGQLKLIDFNVAQQIRGGSSGTIVGKHAYLPPEQFRGKATTQSDLYAFGASLFFLLTGKDPEPISQSSPSSLKPETSRTFDLVVEKATELQIERRYQSIDEIEADLSGIQPETSDAPVSVHLKKEEEVTLHG